MPTKVEEVVLNADALQTEDVGKQPGEQLLLWRPWRAVRQGRVEVRRWERASVELAVGRRGRRSRGTIAVGTM